MTSMATRLSKEAEDYIVKNFDTLDGKATLTYQFCIEHPTICSMDLISVSPNNVAVAIGWIFRWEKDQYSYSGDPHTCLAFNPMGKAKWEVLDKVGLIRQQTLWHSRHSGDYSDDNKSIAQYFYIRDSDYNPDSEECNYARWKRMSDELKAANKPKKVEEVKPVKPKVTRRKVAKPTIKYTFDDYDLEIPTL